MSLKGKIATLFFLTSLLEYNCFTMLHSFLLYNKVNQLYIYIYPHISSLLRLPPSHPSRSSQSTELISLCYAAASHQLFILHLVVYICPCHSLTSPQLTLPPPHVLKSILYICVFIPVLPLGSSAPVVFCFLFFFRFHIYALAYSICFSLSHLLHFERQTLGPSTSLQITQFCFFLWLSNIPLDICVTSSLCIHLSVDTQVASMSWLL